MIGASIEPRQLEVGQPAELTVRLANIGVGACTNLVLNLKLPVQILLLRGTGRIEVARLDAGESATSTVRVRPQKAGTWALTSSHFSYQDARGFSRHGDLRLDLQVVPGDPAAQPRPNAGTKASPGRQGIFISYRHQETRLAAGHLARRLRRRLDAALVFRDTESIELGVDFRKVIGEALESCALALVLIGPQWIRMTDEQGRRRLDDPGDFVRVEVETVLGRDLRVIPVLVGGVSMPRPEALPDSLAALAYRRAALLRDEPFEQFGRDLEALVDEVARLFPARG